ncbi:MAG: prepilin-type N-terminal cleavage/methylation domain-containing protein [Candidatus Hydrogenedentes bacterium]|nr:prepilin-type N-terminal cleavage/methylation domain-containing protein [Candidatus Hydrogenedentota bacterium]
MSGRRSRAGFTLMEVIVALAIIAVAATISVRMFGQSFTAGSDVRDRRAAFGHAEELLADMQRDPASFVWPAANDQLQPVAKKDGHVKVAPPAVRATYPRANNAIVAQYDKFSWRAYVKLPAGAKTCELTAVVSWVRGGKTRSVTLTALAPRAVAGANP